MPRQQYIEARLIIPWNTDGDADDAAAIVKFAEHQAVAYSVRGAEVTGKPYGWIIGFEVHDGPAPRDP